MKAEKLTELEKVYAEREGAIGWIVFNQPEKRNAISLDSGRRCPGWCNPTWTTRKCA